MTDKNEAFIHDTINLDEIRGLIDEKQAEPAVKESMNQKVEEPQTKNEQKKTDPTQEEPKGFMYEAYGLLHDLVYILAFVTLLFVFVVRLVGVDGTSMLPTLHHGDILLLESNFLYDTDRIENGDIVVLNEPYHWRRDNSLIVKRVIATEGQTIDIDYEKGEVYVDGVLLQEDYIYEPTYFSWDGEYATELPAVVPEGHVFVLGDNRNNSSDSRFALVGMIDERCVLGKAIVVAFPGKTTDQYGNVTASREWGRIGLVR